jgi:hypothetical protein
MKAGLKIRGSGPGWAKTLLGLLTFLVLTEDSGCVYAEHLGAPLAWVRSVFLEPLPIKIRLFDIILIGVLVAASSKRDMYGPNVRPMKNALFILLGGTVFCFLYGLLHGGEFRFASWQTYLILSTILYAFTAAATFRTPADYVGLAKWLLAGATYRALMCWISYFTWGRSTLGESGAFLTTHDDTIGWVVAIMVCIINAIDRRSLLVTLRNLLFMLFFVGAIQFNSRRLAWVSLGMGVTVMYFLFPPGAAKKRITRVLIAVVPLIALYVIVGWGRQNPIFLPLRSLSTVSTQEDGSTLARNAENLGLIATANVNGFAFGSGWGRPYIYLTLKYDISGAFELWQYVPHNSILGILAFTGLFGAAVFWTTIATAVFLNVRVAKLASDQLSRSVAIIGAAQVVVCLNQLYGDMGIFFFKPMYFLAISFAMAMRLPLVANVWGTPARAPARVAAQ